MAINVTERTATLEAIRTMLQTQAQQATNDLAQTPHPNHTDRTYTAGKLTALAHAIHETDTMLAALRATNTSDGTHHA